MLLVLCLLAACEDSIDDLSGKYDMDRYSFNVNTLIQQPTEKRGKGIKALIMKMVDENRDTLLVEFGSREWTLPTGTYTLTTKKVTQAKEYTAYWIEEGTTSTMQVTSGTVDVQITGDTYFFNGLLTDGSNRRFKLDYKGSLSFEIGEDDPEASGYTALFSSQPVYVTDQMGQVTGVVPGVLQYTFAISDPNGNAAASFDIINADNLDVTELAGAYTIQANASEPWQMANGWALPAAWGGWSGGSYVVQDGSKQYLASGTVTISVADGMEGGKLFSFSGSELTSTLGMDETGTNTPGTATAVNIQFVTVLQSTGIELRDQTMQSTVLGRDMAYSVYLPKGYFETDKSYPVLYLLHGADGGNNDWLNGGRVNAYASTQAAESGTEMIVVCPNCTVDGKNLFYVNGYQGDAQYMTYFFDEFLPFIESTYRIQGDRAHRAVGGLSMGGYGSLYYGSLHPEMFCYVYACSPATYIDGTPNIYDLYGAALGAGSELPGITIEIGTGDFLYESCVSFEGFLTGMGIQHEYITRDGIHDWAFWMACTPKIMKKLSEVFPAE